jgi:hypothetical protein
MILEAVISTIGGGILRLIPEYLSIKDKEKARDHEFRMFDLQLEADKLRSKLRIDEARVEVEGKEVLAEIGAIVDAAKAQATQTGIKFIDALNASVRPVLTYWWCVLLYTAHKGTLTFLALKNDLPLDQVAGTVFTTFDASVVASMIGFWFVDRALRKLRS